MALNCALIAQRWYKQWKVRSGCLEKFALGNSRESNIGYRVGCLDTKRFQQLHLYKILTRLKKKAPVWKKF